MATFQFLVPQASRLPPRAAERAYFCGSDEIPWLSRITSSGAGISVHRPDRDSGSLHIPWQTETQGELMLGTASLMHRQEAYHLPVELARGSLNRLRGQAWVWQAAGLDTPAAYQQAQQAALRHLAQAVAQQGNPLAAAEEARLSIESCLRAGDLLIDAYCEQAIHARRQAGRGVPLFGCDLGEAFTSEPLAAQFRSLFNTAVIPCCWRTTESVEGKQNWKLPDAQLAWAHAQGMRTCGGPLIELSSKTIPDWVYLWEGDFDNLLSLASDFVKSVVQRYAGRVHLWNCATGINTGTALSLSEQQRLRLVVRMVELARAHDPKAPLFVSFDQPWAEYVPRRSMDLSPLSFADTLIRADIGLSALGVEIDLGPSPEGTARRHPLELSRLIDRWSQLGVPLLVSLTATGANTAQEQADLARWLQKYVPLLLAKHSVQAVLWKTFQSQHGKGKPEAGLLDEQGRPTKLYPAMEAVRRQYLA